MCGICTNNLVKNPLKITTPTKNGITAVENCVSADSRFV